MSKNTDFTNSPETDTPDPVDPLAASLEASLSDTDDDGDNVEVLEPAGEVAELQAIARELELDDDETTTLVVAGGGVTPVQAAALRAAAKFLEANVAESTRTNYEGDFALFTKWCHQSGHSPLPATPLTVMMYLGHLGAQKKPSGDARFAISTLERRLAAINWKHETAGYLTPTAHTAVRRVMKGIRRTNGRRLKQKPPLSTNQIARIVATLDLDTGAGIRDRAVLLLGFAGAFRRSELAALDKEQISRRFEEDREGLVIALEHTKDDQEGKGRKVGIPAFSGSPLCPVAAYDAWLHTAGMARVDRGPVFRRIDRWGHIGTQPLSPQSIALIVKRAARAAGIAGAPEFAGHSLRAGHATTAADNQAPDRWIMATTGHTS